MVGFVNKDLNRFFENMKNINNSLSNVSFSDIAKESLKNGVEPSADLIIGALSSPNAFAEIGNLGKNEPSKNITQIAEVQKLAQHDKQKPNLNQEHEIDPHGIGMALKAFTGMTFDDVAKTSSGVVAAPKGTPAVEAQNKGKGGPSFDV